tara:strand:- start:3194 stop:3295 length:102 start_codon:yes stop_codon:yes gene_type:complete
MSKLQLLQENPNLAAVTQIGDATTTALNVMERL